MVNFDVFVVNFIANFVVIFVVDFALNYIDRISSQQTKYLVV